MTKSEEQKLSIKVNLQFPEMKKFHFESRIPSPWIKTCRCCRFTLTMSQHQFTNQGVLSLPSSSGSSVCCVWASEREMLFSLSPTSDEPESGKSTSPITMHSISILLQLNLSVFICSLMCFPYPNYHTLLFCLSEKCVHFRNGSLTTCKATDPDGNADILVRIYCSWFSI